MSVIVKQLVRAAGSTAIIGVAASLAIGTVLAQKAESKEAAAFRKEVQQVQTSITKAKRQLEATLATYNDLLKEGNQKLEPGHKKLVGTSARARAWWPTSASRRTL